MKVCKATMDLKDRQMVRMDFTDRQTDAPQGWCWLPSLKFLLAIKLLAISLCFDDCPKVSVFFVGLVSQQAHAEHTMYPTNPR